MRILWFTYRLPFPVDSGGKVRAYNLIKQVSRNHEIILFSFVREKKELVGLDELRKYCSHIFTFQRRTLFNPLNFFYATFLPFPAALYYSPPIKNKLASITKELNIDLIHLESFYTGVYLQNSIRVPIIMGNENVEYQIYQRRTDLTKPPAKTILHLDTIRMKKFEEDLWRGARINLAVSESDAKVIEEVTKKPCYVIPNGVDIDFFAKTKKQKLESPTVLFVGDFNYIQNQDAVRFLVKEIWPLVSKKISNIKLLLVGRNPTREILNSKTPSIEILPNVEDIRTAYGAASIFIAPLRVAGGTQLKILEAAATGLPIITSPLAKKGLKTTQEEILTADTASDFASKITLLVKNRNFSDKIGKAALGLVRDSYSWVEIGKKLEDVYKAATKN